LFLEPICLVTRGRVFGHLCRLQVSDDPRAGENAGRGARFRSLGSAIAPTDALSDGDTEKRVPDRVVRGMLLAHTGLTV
jgi:hypothetical protein